MVLGSVDSNRKEEKPQVVSLQHNDSVCCVVRREGKRSVKFEAIYISSKNIMPQQLIENSG
jgi:hypothetical protein